MIYTKEPWEIQNGSTGYYIIAKDGDNHVAVAQIFPRGMAGCETKGNAGLMKAAPKMYEALKLAWTLIAPQCHHSTVKTVADICSKALAEAEGKEGEDANSN